ncbi:MAG TPA: DUF6089 family protein [Puia sp.]|jgi:hypothetical protein
MKQFFLSGIFFCFLVIRTIAQPDHSYLYTGEFGVLAGASQYFGDLNPDLHFNTPKTVFGLFFRKQITNYIAVRIQGQFAQLGYSDVYNKQNAFYLRRNLSFNTNVWQLGVQGDFNFFRFIPGDGDHRATPYLTIGIGMFSFDPYAYLAGQKYYLRELGTEGQGSAAYPDRKPYSNIAAYIPLGLGYKYNLNPKMNIGIEAVYNFTTTDYLDDVSKTYAGINNFPTLPDGAPSIAALLQDRSYETGSPPIGIQGRQRGYQNQNDGFLYLEIMFSMNLSSYKCPTY